MGQRGGMGRGEAWAVKKLHSLQFITQLTNQPTDLQRQLGAPELLRDLQQGGGGRVMGAARLESRHLKWRTHNRSSTLRLPQSRTVAPPPPHTHTHLVDEG